MAGKFVFNPFSGTFDWTDTTDLSGYIPFNASKGADLGDGTDNPLVNFKTAAPTYPVDGVLTWGVILPGSFIGNGFSMYRSGDVPFAYPPYSPILSLGTTAKENNLLTPVGLQIYVKPPAATHNASEMYGFWGGVHDEGVSKGCDYDAGGLFAYNAMQSTSARTYSGIWGVIAFNETGGGDNLTVTSIGGGRFSAGDGVGIVACTYAYGILIQTGGSSLAVINYGLYIESVSAGTDKYSIYTNDGKISFGDDVYIRTDADKLFLGGGADMTIWYDGTDGNIKTNDVAASDLNITCGAAKTLELQTGVYEDLQFSVSNARVPAANYPDWETFTTNTAEYSFAVDDYIDCQANEVPHSWQEGTAGDAHLHLALKAAQSDGANRFAKFSLYFAISDSSQAGTKVWAELTTRTAEITIPTGTAALTGLYLDMGDLTLTSYKVGSQMRVRIKRIAATGGTEYNSQIFITQCGVHLKRDTLGSRGETTK